MPRLLKQRVIELSSFFGPDPIAIAQRLYEDDLRAELLFGIPMLWDGESEVRATDFATWNCMRSFEMRAAGENHLGVGSFVDAAGVAVAHGAKVTPITAS